MKTRIRIAPLLILLLCLLPGCVKNEFTVEFKFPQSYSAPVRLVYYAESSKNGALFERVATPVAGKATLECPTAGPAVVFLFSRSGLNPAAYFYAERGDRIKVEATTESPYEWKISGNEISEEWTSFRLANKDILRADNREKINAAVTAYVKKHPDSKLSPYLLLTQYDRYSDERGFARLWKSLDKKADADEAMQIVGRADFLDASSPIADAPLENLRLASRDSLPILLQPRKAKASILYFWTGYEHVGNANTDTLRALAKAFPDSASRLIADIGMAPDSISWASSTRSDTLKGVARGWTPLGLADRRLMKIGVLQPSFFIVADHAGKQLYRGEDPAKAAAAFRRLLKK